MITILFFYFFSIIFSDDKIPVYSQKFQNTETGFTGTCTLQSGEGPYGDDVQNIDFDIIYETEDRLHIRYREHGKEYPDIPGVIADNRTVTKINNPHYAVYFDSTFGFTVKRKRDDAIIFDTRASSVNYPFVFEKQYVQFSARIEANPKVYGLGQRRTEFLLKYPFEYIVNNQDNATPDGGLNLYGSHTFYIQRSNNSAFYGVFLFNIAPLVVNLENGSVTFKMMQGPIDLYIFVGPSMKNVVSQYTELVGRPCLLPEWSLGIHNCRWGVKTLNDTKEVFDNYKAYEIPLDVMWSDIDFMDQYRCFTTDPVNYPREEFKQFITDCHNDDVRYVVMTDPGIDIPKNDSEDEDSYPIYDELLESGLYIKNRTNQKYIGMVWPDEVLFPDFTNPDIYPLWSKWAVDFKNDLDLDGMWLDMNEIANFVDGEITPDADVTKYPFEVNNLRYHTCPPDAILHMGQYIYCHNLYAMYENMYTRQAFLENEPGVRPFLLTRSSFAGSGKYGTLWLGDNTATYEDLKDSIAGILTQGLFGMPITGTDIGGFNKDGDNVTTETMTTRWTETGAFCYPFLRVHSSQEQPAHYFYSTNSTHNDVRKKYLHARHSLMMYFNTLMHEAHEKGTPILRSFVMEYPNDEETVGIDTQAFLGDAIMICPVYGGENAVSVSNLYFPSDRWYDYWTGEEKEDLESDNIKKARKAEAHVAIEAERMKRSASFLDHKAANGKKNVLLDAPLDTTPIFIRGGNIIVKQRKQNQRWEKMKDSPVSIVICLDENGFAEGKVVVDDGVSINENGDSNYTCVRFNFSRTEHPDMDHYFTSTILPFHYNTDIYISEILIYGADDEPDLSSFKFSGGRNAFISYSKTDKLIRIVPSSLEDEDKLKWKICQRLDFYYKDKKV